MNKVYKNIKSGELFEEIVIKILKMAGYIVERNVYKNIDRAIDAVAIKSIPVK